MRLGPRRDAPIFSVMRDRDFRAIWYVGSLRELSRRMELLVLSWLILQATQSPFQLGLVLVFNNLPRPALSLFTGFIADRFDRWRILMTSQIINTLVAAALLALMVSDAIEAWHIFAAVFLQGATKALEDPSRRTGILDIVGERRLVNALSLDNISNTAGKMAGPLLGGIMIDTSGPLISGMVGGVSVDNGGFVGAAGLILLVHLADLVVMTRVRIPRKERSATLEPVWQSLGSGIRYALATPLLWGMLYVTIIMNALAFPLQQFIPDIGANSLGVGATLVGLLVAGEGIGQLIGAGGMALTRNLERHGLVFVVGSTAVLIMGILFVWSPWYMLAFMVLVLGGIGQSGFGTMQSTITMLAAPPEMRGRMVGLMSVCIGIGTPLGGLALGILAEYFGTSQAVTVNALAGLALLVPSLVLTPLAWRPTRQAGQLQSD
ncbi:MAG: MFS transporter [Chloroflexi bacterium]|nr:MFS transporter [Chloroflexota bacterium]